MSGISRPWTLSPTLYKTVGAEQGVTLVTAYGHFLTEMRAAHGIKLTHAGTGHEGIKDVTAVKDNTRTEYIQFGLCLNMGIETLSAYAKTTTEKGYRT